MLAYGKAPHIECSSRGDKRFSAFAARIRGRGGRTIEDLYQAAKIFEDGATGLNWRDAKGRRAVNAEQCATLYATLWDEYMAENPALLPILLAVSGVSDMFGQAGHCCQATELWRIAEAAQCWSMMRPICGSPGQGSISWCSWISLTRSLSLISCIPTVIFRVMLRRWLPLEM